MDKKTSKSGAISAIIIAAVLLALLNVCTFAIPFNKVDSSVHYVAYGCAEAIILIQAILIISQIFMNKTPNQRIMALPMVFNGAITLVMQILATAIFYVINAFVALPLWVVIIVECLIVGFAAIQLAKGYFFKARSEEYHENIANTKFMDVFRAKLKALYQINKIDSIERMLGDLLDTALGSDPVTNDMTVELEGELQSLLQQLGKAVKDGSEADARAVIEKTKDALAERNALCKAGK